MSFTYIISYDPDPEVPGFDGIPGVEVDALWATTPQGVTPPKVGTTRTFFDIPPTKIVTLSSLGDKFTSKKPNARKELVRRSVGAAVKDLKVMEGIKDISVVTHIDPHAAGKILLSFLCGISLIA